MQEVQFYQCDFCGKKYESQADCQNCEDNHKGGIINPTGGFEIDCEISKLVFKPYSERRNGYPEHVFVKFPNGETVDYIDNALRTFAVER